MHDYRAAGHQFHFRASSPSSPRRARRARSRGLGSGRRPQRLPDYSGGIERVDLTAGRDARICHFHPRDGAAGGMVLRELIRWEARDLGYATSADPANEFGLANDLSLVTVVATPPGTLLTGSGLGSPRPSDDARGLRSGHRGHRPAAGRTIRWAHRRAVCRRPLIRPHLRRGATQPISIRRRSRNLRSASKFDSRRHVRGRAAAGRATQQALVVGQWVAL